jgi:hypothetical protein
MGELAGLDVGFEQRGLFGWDTTAEFMGDGRLAIEMFVEYQERYSKRHCYQPSRIALLWKAGPGTVARVNELLGDGLTMSDAIDQAAKELGVPNALKYVKQFRKEREMWARWVATQDEPPSTCVDLPSSLGAVDEPKRVKQ